ncbi:MAG: zf-HC2 domain-containing protein [Ilumatobacter sp.]|uniref:zf-HC2 domain-containing protein n=1 Tax=Ilumatobacter sp. TaxID=1967498 RepID=UPI00260E1E10|nr:zf-HC2 domain-containing protein [Ilumatobacter sp.]MDJ0769053.1 zf-HC2 domain-containing protein [Ilumatobacter sp.]
MEPHTGSKACARARELMSAASDLELGGRGERELDTHLASCPDCREYAERLAGLTRAIRLRPADRDGEFVERVMRGSGKLGRGRWLRPALAWCGVVVIARSVEPLLLGEVDDAPTHVARHVGAWGLALGIGFLYAAWRPQRASGLMPLVVALLATMLVSATFDMVGGVRSLADELVHLVELVGLVLLWMVAGSPGLTRVGDAWRSFRAGRAVVQTTN